jgi:hypothetical protein
MKEVSDNIFFNVKEIETLSIPSKTVLLEEGKIADKIYLVRKGCLRLFFYNEGKDITFQFFFEGDFVACALALMMMQDIPYDFQMFAGFIFMLGVTMVAAPGVPGGAIMASLGILSSMLGFDENAQALMIALYIAMDSFGTACNVTGDGALALLIDKWFGKSKTNISSTSPQN